MSDKFTPKRKLSGSKQDLFPYREWNMRDPQSGVKVSKLIKKSRKK